jgi:hypothetical protein
MVAPKHIRMKLKCPEPAILVDANNLIVAANEAWQDQCGYGEEAIGANPKILQGELTDRAKAMRFANRVYGHEGKAGTTLVNYKADGTPFLHTIVAERIGAFFVAKTMRAIHPPMAPQLFSIGIAILLTCAIALAFSAAATGLTLQATQLVPLTNMPSAISAEALPLASLSLLACLVAMSNDAPQHFAVATAVLLTAALALAFSALPADLTSQATPLSTSLITTIPSALVGEATPLAALSLLACLVAMINDASATNEPGKRRPSDEAVLVDGMLLGPVPLTEILITAAVCMFLVVQDGVGPQLQ